MINEALTSSSMVVCDELSIKERVGVPGDVLYVKTTVFLGLLDHSVNRSRENPHVRSATLASTTCRPHSKYIYFTNWKHRDLYICARSVRQVMDQGFSLPFMAKRKTHGPRKQGRKKRGSVTCHMDRENEVNKIFIIWLC